MQARRLAGGTFWLGNSCFLDELDAVFPLVAEPRIVLAARKIRALAAEAQWKDMNVIPSARDSRETEHTEAILWARSSVRAFHYAGVVLPVSDMKSIQVLMHRTA